MINLNQTSKLDFVVKVLLALDNLDYSKEDNKFTGYLSNNSPYEYNQIIDIANNFYIDTDDSTEEENKIVFDIVDTGAYYSLDDYLKNPKRRTQINPPLDFYIIEDNFYYKANEASDNDTPLFLKVAKLFDALSTISDFQADDGNEPYIVFFSKKNIKINFVYNSVDLNNNLKKIDSFIQNYIFQEFQNEDRILAVRNGLNECYPESQISFSKFLERFDNLHTLVRNNYQLYIDKFSFDDFKNKVEEDRREYTIKINKVFSDMQNQLLTLPIATVLAAGQMSLISSAGDFIKNVLIIVGISVFCVFVLMQIANQVVSLNAIKDEIMLKQEDMKRKEQSDYKDKFLEVYSSLNERVSKLDHNLTLVKSITLVATCLVYLVFIARFYW